MLGNCAGIVFENAQGLTNTSICEIGTRERERGGDRVRGGERERTGGRSEKEKDGGGKTEEREREMKGENRREGEREKGDFNFLVDVPKEPSQSQMSIYVH